MAIERREQAREASAGSDVHDDAYEVDPAYRVFVSYIDKSREFYAAQGYGQPYRWVYHRDAPFTPLPKPLAECRVGVVTTATLMHLAVHGLPEGAAAALQADPSWEPHPDDTPPLEVFAEPSDPPPARMYTQHRSWDKDATHTGDLDTFCPLNRLRELADEGRIGSLSPRFYGVPTDYSQRRTREHDAPEVLRLMREDGVDVAVLVPL